MSILPRTLPCDLQDVAEEIFVDWVVLAAGMVVLADFFMAVAPRF